MAKREKYIELENKYKEAFEQYVLQNIDLKKYDILISTSELGFGDVTIKPNFKSSLDEYLGLNHFYVLNNFYVEKLSEIDISILNYGSIEDRINIVKDTYKNVIKYGDTNDTLKINYTFSTSLSAFSNSDQLVLAMYYGNNKYQYNNKQEFLDNYTKQEEFMNQLAHQIGKEFEEKLNLSVKFIIEKI